MRDLARTRPATALAASALLVLMASGAAAQANLGDPAPDWTLLGNDGNEHSLSDGFGSQVQLLHMIGYA